MPDTTHLSFVFHMIWGILGVRSYYFQADRRWVEAG